MKSGHWTPMMVCWPMKVNTLLVGTISTPPLAPSAIPVNTSAVASVARNALTRSFRDDRAVDEAQERPGEDRDREAPPHPQCTATHAPRTSASVKIAPSERSKFPATIVSVTAHAGIRRSRSGRPG